MTSSHSWVLTLFLFLVHSCHPSTVYFSYQTTVKESATEEKLTPVVLAKQLAALKQQLVASHLEKLLGPDAAINLTDPDGALAKWVLYLVEKSLLIGV